MQRRMRPRAYIGGVCGSGGHLLDDGQTLLCNNVPNRGECACVPQIEFLHLWLSCVRQHAS